MQVQPFQIVDMKGDCDVVAGGIEPWSATLIVIQRDRADGTKHLAYCGWLIKIAPL